MIMFVVIIAFVVSQERTEKCRGASPLAGCHLVTGVCCSFE